MQPVIDSVNNRWVALETNRMARKIWTKTVRRAYEKSVQTAKEHAQGMVSTDLYEALKYEHAFEDE